MSESMTTYGIRQQELQSLRHQLTDAVYASTDIERLRSCLLSLKGLVRSSNKDKDKVLSREEGEQLVCDTFVPAYKDALRAEKDGAEFSDISELFVELEKEKK